MLLFAPAALAAPLAPVGADRPGVEVAAFIARRTTWNAEMSCTGGGCDAWRTGTLTGGEVRVALARPLAVYAHAAAVDERIDAALYGGSGYALGGGALGRIDLAPRLGLHGWIGLEHQFTGNADLSERAPVWEIDAGAVLRGGDTADGFQGWIGVGVVPWSDTGATVLSGELALALRPLVPLEGVAGAQFVSDRLGGPGDDRTRLGVGVAGSLGYRSSVTGFLSLQL